MGELIRVYVPGERFRRGTPGASRRVVTALRVTAIVRQVLRGPRFTAPRAHARVYVCVRACVWWLRYGCVRVIPHRENVWKKSTN